MVDYQTTSHFEGNIGVIYRGIYLTTVITTLFCCLDICLHELIYLNLTMWIKKLQKNRESCEVCPSLYAF